MIGFHGSWTPTVSESYRQVELELRSGSAPTVCTSGFSVEFVWKGTTFERMQSAMKRH